MIDLSPCRAVILVFASPDCPACIDYKPRLEKEVKRWAANGAPLVWAVDDVALPAGSVALVMIDVTSSDLNIQGYADMYQVQALPTTVVLTRSGMNKIEGAIDDSEIYSMLLSATR